MATAHADHGALSRVARRALAAYDVPPGVSVRLHTVSENATFFVDDPAGPAVLRVHRQGYSTPAEIAAELAWVDALRLEAGVRTARVVPARSGERIVTASDPELAGARSCVLFERLPGQEPPADQLLEAFDRLGELTARMHRHARGWHLPSGFARRRWDVETTLGSAPHWGQWADGVGVGQAERALLGRAARSVRNRLVEFGDGPDRFGLVHADLRLANLLVHDGSVSVIDFDDCGFSWYLYDLAAALSFLEHRPEVPSLVDAWLTGYRRVTTLSRAEEAEIPTFILLRRLLLVAWVGSHRDTELARAHGTEFTAASCELAERYLGAQRRAG